VIWLKLKGYLIAAGVFLAALAGAVLYGRAKGKAAEQVKTRAAQDEAATAQAKAEQLEARHETDAAVERLPDAPPGVSLGDAPPDSAAGRLSDWAE
jgi:hypothetical protein